jgi:FixJ family two-component response regulator
MSGSWLRVAIVEDDPAVLKALTRLIGANSFDARAYGSAREFLASLSNALPHCLVVDLHMPDMAALDLQHYLTSAGFKIPTIVITGRDAAGLRQRCQSAGAAAYLLKPLSEATLMAAIHSATGAAEA